MSGLDTLWDAVLDKTYHEPPTAPWRVVFVREGQAPPLPKPAKAKSTFAPSEEQFRTTAERRAEIFRLRAEGLKVSEIADRMGLTTSMVSLVLNGKRWAWAQD